MGARDTTPSRYHEAWAAIGSVTDPELDQSVTELGFITRFEVDETSESENEKELCCGVSGTPACRNA